MYNRRKEKDFGGHDMEQYGLDPALYQVIVDGTLSGYKNYLNERLEKKKTMTVSGAYAWTKGNHIDDQIALLGKQVGIDYTLEKAGYTWEYLQFTLQQTNEKFMVIIKNSKMIKKTFEGNGTKTKNQEHYLYELADINSEILKNNRDNFVRQPQQISLELNLPELKSSYIKEKINSNEKFSRFYIVTYEIDDQSKLITSILLTLPDSEDMSLLQVANLTNYISTSSIQITHEDVEPILHEKFSNEIIFSGEKDSFGYAIPKTEEEERAN